MRVLRDVRWLMVPLVSILLAGSSLSQQPSEVSVSNEPFPKAFSGQPYKWDLKVRGGIASFKWRLESGSLPKGLSLSEKGVVSGIPRETGEFRFAVTVADSSIPAHERNQEFVLRVVGALVARWGRSPKVNGQRIEGSVKISNQTEDDFDLTFIAVAVNETGRATALGYQRLTVKKDTIDMEIPFGEALPVGRYEVNADVVGEVAAKNLIHRARLATADRLSVQPVL